MENRTEQELYRQIVQQFVLEHGDFFICLDLKENRILRSLKGEEYFPEGGCYTQAMEAYIEGCVSEADRAFFRRHTTLEDLRSGLEKKESCSCFFSTCRKVESCRRKKLQYARGPEGCTFLMCRDVTESFRQRRRCCQLFDEMRNSAMMDSLTGLYNREAISNKIKEALKEEGEGNFILLFIDLDHFKQVNDTMGHRFGDEVLCRVAGILKENLEPGHLLGRVGGDEFVALLLGIHSLEEGKAQAERLCRAVAGMEVSPVMDLPISCSIGGAVCPADGRDYETLLYKADMAGYEAKRRGKDQFYFYNI